MDKTQIIIDGKEYVQIDSLENDYISKSAVKQKIIQTLIDLGLVNPPEEEVPEPQEEEAPKPKKGFFKK